MIYKPDELKIPNQILRAAESGNLIFFVGNGLSRIYHFPSWDQLVERFLTDLVDSEVISPEYMVSIIEIPSLKTKISIAHNLLVENSITHPELLSKAYSKHLLRDSTIIEELLNKTSIYRHLVDLGITIVTTNYDNMIDHCVLESDINSIEKTPILGKGKSETNTLADPNVENRNLVLSPADIKSSLLLKKGTVIHLHGTAQEPNSCIITTPQYLEHYSSPNIKEFLENLFNRYTVVFLGYGLDELEILEQIFRTSQSEQSKQTRDNVFALLPILSSQTAMYPELSLYFKNLGVTSLGYDIQSEDYTAIETILKNWLPIIQIHAREVSREEHIHLLDKYIHIVETNGTNLNHYQTEAIIKMISENSKDRRYFFSIISSHKWLDFFKNDQLIKLLTAADENSKDFIALFAYYLNKLVKDNNVTTNQNLILQILEGLSFLNCEIDDPFINTTLTRIYGKLSLKYLSSEEVKKIFYLFDNSQRTPSNLYDHILIEIFTNQIKIEQDADDPNLMLFFSLFFETVEKKDTRRQPEFKYNLDTYQLSKNLFHNLKLQNAPINNIITLCHFLIHKIDSDLSIERLGLKLHQLDDQGRNNYSTSPIITLSILLNRILSHFHSVPSIVTLIQLISEKKHPIYKKIFLKIASVDFTTHGKEAMNFMSSNFNSRTYSNNFHRLINANFLKLSDSQKSVLLSNIIKYEAASEHSDSEEKKHIRNAWEQLSWIESLKPFHIKELEDCRKNALKLTENRIPDPFNDKMPIRLTNALDAEDIGKLICPTLDLFIIEIKKLMSKPSDIFNSSIDIIINSFRLMLESDELRFSYLYNYSSEVPLKIYITLFEHNSKIWSKSKSINWDRLIKLAQQILSNLSTDTYTAEDKDTFINCLSRLIESGVSNDECAMDSSNNLLALEALYHALPNFKQDPNYNIMSDSRGRSINEPRGVILSSIFNIILHNTRIEESSNVFDRKFWQTNKGIFETLMNSNDGEEISLFSLLGHYYPQFFYIDEKWYMANFSKIFLNPNSFPIHWEASMEGFVSSHYLIKELYNELNRHEFLLKILQLDLDKDDSHNTLNSAITQLTVLSYLMENEELEDSKSLISFFLNSDDTKTFIGLFCLSNESFNAPALFTRKKKLALGMLDKIIKNKEISKDVSVFQLLELLPLFTINETAVEHIVDVCILSKEAWYFDQLILYFINNLETSELRVSSLFRKIVCESDPPPSYPEDRIRELYLKLKSSLDSEVIKNIVAIRHYYFATIPDGGPLRGT